MMKIKASLLRYCEMSWPSLALLKRWMKLAASFNGFDLDGFSNPSLKIAQATDADDQPICFCPVETVFLVSAYAVSPAATQAEARKAGDALDALIARQATMSGVSKMLIVVPRDHPELEGEWKEVRIYERKIQPTVMQGGCHTSSPVAYLN